MVRPRPRRSAVGSRPTHAGEIEGDRGLRPAAALALLALAAGCAGTRTFVIPPVDAAGLESGRQIPAAVGLAFPSSLAGRTAVQVSKGAEGESRYVLPIGDAVVETYGALAPRLFESVQRVPLGVSPPADAHLDGVLEVDLGEVTVSLPTAGQPSPCRVTVQQAFTLRDAKGVVVARWDALATGEASRGALVDCGGTAAADALDGAAASLVRRLDTDPAVREWLTRMGRKWEPPGSPRDVRRSWRAGPEEEETGPAPRTFGVHGGVGYFWAASSSGHLPQAQGGLVLGVGAAWRPMSWLGLDLQLDNLTSSYSSALARLPPGFVQGSSRLELNQTLLGVRLRLAWPIGIVTPWAGGGPVIGLGVLSWPAASASGYPDSISSAAFAYGLSAGAGLDVAVTRNVVLGARWTWLWSWTDFGSLSGGTAQVGGNVLVVSGGYYWP
jgi:opacity protein-like surface antigen